jgi:uncharacterized protein
MARCYTDADGRDVGVSPGAGLGRGDGRGENHVAEVGAGLLEHSAVGLVGTPRGTPAGHRHVANRPLRQGEQHEVEHVVSTKRYSPAMETPANPSAGELLREARLRSGLSQAELGRRAGVAQSVISAYESGRRQPALPMLARLIQAAGQELRMSVEEPRPELLSGPLGRLVRQRRADVLAAAHDHGVSHVRVFGSVARGDDRPGSDVDLLVDLPPGLGLLGLGRLADALERALGGVRVEVVPESDLKPDVRARVEAEAVEL